MAKIILSILILTALSTTIPAQSTYYSRSKPYSPVQEMKTKLRFYIHDILSGKNPTAIQVGGPKNKTNPTPFGSTFAIDDVLTEGPDINSTVVGNAQGMYVSTNQAGNLTLVMYVDLGFTTGEFEGSSLSVFSRNPVTEKVREMAVVGGRGRFKMARGFVLVKTLYFNKTNGDAVLEYDVEVVHHIHDEGLVLSCMEYQ